MPLVHSTSMVRLVGCECSKNNPQPVVRQCVTDDELAHKYGEVASFELSKKCSVSENLVQWPLSVFILPLCSPSHRLGASI